jgi:hypothetical protein
VNSQALESPTLLTFALSDTLPVSADGRTLRALDIWEDGTVKVTDTAGNTLTRTFAGITGALPYRWVLQIRQVWSTGTTVPIGSLDGLN